MTPRESSKLFESPKKAGIAWLVDYETRASSRYRRFLSIVLLGASDERKLLEALSGTVRGTDVVGHLDGDVIVVMGETPPRGAVKAIGRYGEAIEDAFETFFAMASSPGDGIDSGALLATARRRLVRARASPPGTAVTSG